MYIKPICLKTWQHILHYCTIDLKLFLWCKTVLTWILAIAIYQFLMAYLGLFPEILEYIHSEWFKTFHSVSPGKHNMCKFWPFKLLSNDKFLNWRQRNKEKPFSLTICLYENLYMVLTFLSFMLTGQNCFLDVDQHLETAGIKDVAESVLAPGSHWKSSLFCFE